MRVLAVLSLALCACGPRVDHVSTIESDTHGRPYTLTYCTRDYLYATQPNTAKADADRFFAWASAAEGIDPLAPSLDDRPMTYGLCRYIPKTDACELFIIQNDPEHPDWRAPVRVQHETAHLIQLRYGWTEAEPLWRDLYENHPLAVTHPEILDALHTGIPPDSPGTP